MPLSVDITEDAVMAKLGDFLTEITGVEVVQGQTNRVPESKAVDHIIMTPGARQSLATTQRFWKPEDDQIDVSRSTRINVQIDVYGPSASDNAQVITTLFRDDYACRFFGATMQPLLCDDGTQVPLTNGELQYEDRWTLQAAIQANPSIVTPMQFADNVTVTLIEADQ